jgi:hypothetical protein
VARVFDPVKERGNFERFLLKTELAKAASGKPVAAGAAIQRLETVVLAWLVGLRAQIEPVLRDCHATLQRSFEAREPTGDIYIPAMRSQALALSHWMLNNDNDTAVHQEALNQFDVHFEQGGEEVIDPHFFNKETQRFERKVQRGLPLSDETIAGYLPRYLASCIQGEQYARGVSLYERVGTTKDIDPKRMTKVEELGYWVCRENPVQGRIPTDTYVSVGERILKRYLQNDWLSHGHMLIAAHWLKVLYWHSGVTASALETILKAYDLMPDVQRPPAA